MSNISNHKSVSKKARNEPATKKISQPGLVGFNLSEFAISPLSQKTKDLAHKSVGHAWEQNVPGEGRSQFFFQTSYGAVVPNSETEDLLLILSHLALLSSNPLSVPVSFYKLHQLRQQKYRPNDQQIKQYTRHLDSLMQTIINTNHVYDRQKKRWLSVKSNVLGAYSYKDEKGRIYKQVIDADGITPVGLVSVETKVRELEEINFTSLFFQHFIKDAISIDLAVYFKLLKTPTQRRIYRFGNKYINLYGGHEQDLKLFCKKIGMNPSFVDRTAPYNLKDKLKSHTDRVSTYGGMSVQAVKSKGTESGYKIVFEKEGSQPTLLPFYKQASKPEREAFNILRRAGLYENVARKQVQLNVERMGDLAPEYLKFSVRRFNKLVKSGQLKAPRHRAPAVLATYLDRDWFFAEFMEWKNHKEKTNRKNEERFYEGTRSMQEILGSREHEDEEKVIPQVKQRLPRFSLKSFERKNPLLYKRIASATRRRYTEAREAFTMQGRALNNEGLETAIHNAVSAYCRQVFNEHLKGHTGYFPPDLIG